MSKFVYLITVWGSAQQYLINTLQVQQLTAARIVCGADSFRWSRRKLLQRVGWLSIRQLIFYHTTLQAHKTMATGTPKVLFNSLNSQYNYHTRNAANRNIIAAGIMLEKSFQYRAMKSFNSLPLELKTAPVTSIKPRLKKWIINNIPID